MRRLCLRLSSVAWGSRTERLLNGSTTPTANVPRNADGTPNHRRARATCRRWQARSVGHLVVGRAAARVQRERLHPADEFACRPDQHRAHAEGWATVSAWASQFVAERMANGAKDDPHASCLPPNFPRAYSLPQYLKIADAEALPIMLHEFNASYRQIFTDGRPCRRSATGVERLLHGPLGG